jgi:hypothetical protein
MFTSANGRLVHFTGTFCVALRNADLLQMRYTMGRIALVAGEVYLLRVVIRLLERLVGTTYYCWLDTS